jgi:hypothetical protein
MSDIIITPANVETFPVGTRVRFFWGCPVDTGGGDWEGPQEEEGLVVGWAIKPKTNWFDEKAVLLVDTESGRQHEVTRFVTRGIGAYLMEREGEAA